MNKQKAETLLQKKIKSQGNTPTFFDNFINYLKFIVINENIYKFFCNFFNNNIKILNYSNCKLIIFPAQEYSRLA